MIVRPRIKGFICTTAHPAGCAANVENAARSIAPLDNGPRNALVVGASTGYGLASRIVAAFGAGAGTLGVSLEKPPTERRTATAGWYNNVAFEETARGHGLYANTLDGDAFADQMKSNVIDEIRRSMGQVDLLVYSLASPLRQHPRTGTVHRSVIKPIGEPLRTKTLNQDRGIVHEVDIAPASDAETAATVAVMGGEDWEYWIESLLDANVLAPGFRTVAYTYIGSEISWPIYWHGTLGKAKEDLQRAANAIHDRLGAALRGEARIAVLKAMVTQASSAIPSIPLYTALLFRVMKDASTHEDCAPISTACSAPRCTPTDRRNWTKRDVSAWMIGSWPKKFRPRSDGGGRRSPATTLHNSATPSAFARTFSSSSVSASTASTTKRMSTTRWAAPHRLEFKLPQGMPGRANGLHAGLAEPPGRALYAGISRTQGRHAQP